MRAQPLFVMIKQYKVTKASKIIAGQGKSDSGECIRHASVTPRNTEYTKYDPPRAQVSDDALAQKISLYTPPARLKLRYRYLRAYFFRGKQVLVVYTTMYLEYHTVVVLCQLFWFWQEIVFGVTYILSVQYRKISSSRKKKSSSHLSGRCVIVITTRKKVLVVCLAGARSLLRPEKKIVVFFTRNRMYRI